MKSSKKVDNLRKLLNFSGYYTASVDIAVHVAVVAG